MCSVEHLREFIQQRLTAAAEEIFTQFEKTIVQYEEEMDRQRRLLDISWKPQIKLHRTDFVQQCNVQQKEVQTDQRLCNWERNFRLDQEDPKPPQNKKEPCSSHEGGQFGSEEADTFMETTYEKSYPNEPELKHDQLLSHSSDSFITVHLKPSEILESVNNPIWFKEEMDPQLRALHVTLIPKEELYRTDLLQQLDFSELPEPPRIKEEQEEISISPEGEQLGPEEDTDAFTMIPPYEEPESNSERRLAKPKTSHQRKTRHKSKVFICEMCGKCFNRRDNFSRHMRIHTREKPHACEICGKTFSYDNSLKRHMKFHTGQRKRVFRIWKKILPQPE